jgi:hypothetical protein
MRYYGDHDWTIMGASAWIPGRPSIEKIVQENGGNATIMVVEKVMDPRQEKGTSTFILGSQGNYGQVGEKKTFIRDTGMGYSGTGFCVIQNIITIDENGVTDPGNGVGLREHRPLWVFK